VTIPIGVDPVAFSILGLEIRWYGIAAMAAIVVALAVARAGMRRDGISDALLENGAILVGAAALVGGRILYLIQNDPGMFASDPLHVLAVWHGGLSFYGGLTLGLAALWAYTRYVGLSFARAADVAAPAIAAGQAIGHLGCLIGGDSYGLPASGPLAVVYTNPGAMAPQGIPLHPTQLYEAVSLGMLAVILWVSRDRLGRLGQGAVAAAYLVGNAAIRFALFFLRDDVVVLGGLKVAQLIAIGIAVVGVAWLIGLWRPAHDPRPLEARP
jgi:phosphatidylglycerol---prolipoprotein diacylglyceryl transferase